MDLAAFSAMTRQITATGGLTGADLAQLNNPTASPFSPQQSSELSQVMADIKSGKYQKMAEEDKAKKTEEETKKEEKVDRENRLLDLLEQLVAQGESSSDSDAAKKKKTAAAAALSFGILDDEEETPSNYRSFDETA